MSIILYFVKKINPSNSCSSYSIVPFLLFKHTQKFFLFSMFLGETSSYTQVTMYAKKKWILMETFYLGQTLRTVMDNVFCTTL